MAGKITVGVAGNNGAAGGSGQKNTNNNIQQSSTFDIPTIKRIDGGAVSNNKKDNKNTNKNDDNSAEHQDVVLDPINMATGKFICEGTDYSLPDTNGDYRLIRRYTTEKDRRNKSLGRSWAFNADTHITLEGDSVTVTMPDAKTAIPQNIFTENMDWKKSAFLQGTA